MSWEFVSRLVVRRAGFPMEPLLALAFERSAAAVDVLLDCEDVTRAKRRELLDAFPVHVAEARRESDESALRFLSKVRRKIALGQIATERRDELRRRFGNGVLELECATANEQRARVEAERIFVSELTEKRVLLRTTFADPWMREAVFTSNPDAYENGFAAFLADDLTKRGTKAKALERRFITYLQRFCAKNDTASFFGPMNYGTLGRAQNEPVRLREAPGKMRGRRVYFSFWMVTALAEVIAKDPTIAEKLTPRLHPLWMLNGDRLEPLYGASSHGLDAATSALLRSLDGRTPIAEYAQRARLERLAQKGIVDLGIAIPSTIFDPFGWLEDFVRGTSWSAVLAELRALLDRIPDAPLADRRRISEVLEARFTAITKMPARRLSGKTYADRTLFYEECDGTIEELSFSETFSEDLARRLELVLDLAGSYGQLLQRHYQRLARRVLAGRLTMPYGAFIKAVVESDLGDADEELEAFHARLEALVAAQQSASVVRLDREDLAPLIVDDPTVGLHTSPDVLFAAKDLSALARGDYQLVLGEVHQFLAMWGSQLLFDRDRAEVERETKSLLARLPGYAGLATILNTRRHKGLLHESFPGTFLQLLGHPSANARVEALRDLEVVDDGDVVALRSKRTQERFAIYNSGDDKLHLWAFAVPRVMAPTVHLEGHTPRIEIAGVVFQRERWQLGDAALPKSDPRETELDVFVKLRRLRRVNGLPRFSFFRVASEKKPLFLDFDNFFLAEVLAAELAVNERVTFSEMLPAPDELWLRNDTGRFCVEMRGTAFRIPLPQTTEEVA